MNRRILTAAYAALFMASISIFGFGNGSYVSAQTLSGLARVDPVKSQIIDTRQGITVELGLSQGVPYRIYTLDAPMRLVLDFREIDWTGLTQEALLNSDIASAVRFGGFRPGWSRMVVDLSEPVVVKKAGMAIDTVTGMARLSVAMARVTNEQFAQVSQTPRDPEWGAPIGEAGGAKEAQSGKNTAAQDRIVVVLDPGHGGIDPGAERGGEVEKDLMLAFAYELRDALLRVDGLEVVLTRRDDRFVALERRVAIAHQNGAHLFISLHADVVAGGGAHGAIVHTLSEQASDEASALLAERHNRADMLAGVDLTGKDDVIADVLLDLARMETQPRTERLAEALVAGLQSAGAPLNRRPHRAAAFSVLKAADIPSVLLELGFLSSARDLENLANPAWRQKMAGGIRDAIQAWMINDAALRDLVRQ